MLKMIKPAISECRGALFHRMLKYGSGRLKKGPFKNQMRQVSDKWVKVHTIESIFEKDMIKDALEKEGFAYSIKEHKETAYDGLFILQKGYATLFVEERDRFPRAYTRGTKTVMLYLSEFTPELTPGVLCRLALSVGIQRASASRGGGSGGFAAGGGDASPFVRKKVQAIVKRIKNLPYVAYSKD